MKNLMPAPLHANVRFAPSPTGRFHVGNLRTAWISKVLTREAGLSWLVRFEDIDTPRVLPGAQELQLEDLRALGLVPDQVRIQSLSYERHRSLFELARSQGVVYPCYCSRKEVQAGLERIASAPHEPEPVYSGKCRDLAGPPKSAPSSFGWRLRSVRERGDFLVGRSTPENPFLPSYHWACAVDDWDQSVQLIVRASDLRSAGAPQREIQTWLKQIEGSPKALPSVFLCSLVVQNDGHRLEKRTLGVTLPELLESGMSVERLLACFEASFELEKEFSACRDSAESRDILRLNELLEFRSPRH